MLFYVAPNGAQLLPYDYLLQTFGSYRSYETCELQNLFHMWIFWSKKFRKKFCLEHRIRVISMKNFSSDISL